MPLQQLAAERGSTTDAPTRDEAVEAFGHMRTTVATLAAEVRRLRAQVVTQ